MGSLYYDGNDSNITQVRYKRVVNMSTSISKGYGTSDGSMDPVYGSTKYYPLKTPLSPFRLTLPKPGGGFFTQAEAYNELMIPKWGINGDKVFSDTLPLIPKLIPEFITVSNFVSFDVEVPTDDTVLYILRKLVDSVKNTYMYTNAMPLVYALAGSYYGFTEWKKESDPYTKVIKNPDYEDLNPVREAKLLEYENILKATFKLFGKYIFPGLPTNTSIIPTLIADTALQQAYYSSPWKPWMTRETATSVWDESKRWTAETIPPEFLYHWEILQDGAWKVIPVMSDYWLAMPTVSGYVYKMLEIPNNAGMTVWDSFVNNTQLMIPPTYTASYRTKKLLGL